MTISTFNQIHPVLGQNVYIHPQATVIGDVVLGDDCSVWPQAVIRGDMHRIRVGQRCSIQDNSILHITHAGPHTGEGHPLTIGNDVTIGHQVTLHGCTIGDQVLLGIGSIVLDGAVLESQIVLGAGSLVPPKKHLNSGYLYMGSPAKAVRPLTEKELNYFCYTTSNYVNLKNQYLADAD